jgi:hypothetical protein
LFVDDGRESHSINKIDIARKEMGLDWMLRPAKDVERRPTVSVDHDLEEPPAEEVMLFLFCFLSLYDQLISCLAFFWLVVLAVFLRGTFF